MEQPIQRAPPELAMAVEGLNHVSSSPAAGELEGDSEQLILRARSKSSCSYTVVSSHPTVATSERRGAVGTNPQDECGSDAENMGVAFAAREAEVAGDNTRDFSASNSGIAPPATVTPGASKMGGTWAKEALERRVQPLREATATTTAEVGQVAEETTGESSTSAQGLIFEPAVVSFTSSELCVPTAATVVVINR